MTNNPELNLEDLASKYESLLSREVLRIGERRPTEGFYDRVYYMEISVADKCGLYNPKAPAGIRLKEFIPYRREILLEKLFQRASRLSLDTDLIAKVGMTVCEPILDVLLPHATHGMVSEEARSELNETVPEMLNHHFNLLRPILLLDILDKYPGSAQRLHEGSAYDPASLIPPDPKKRLSPKKAFEMELAQTLVSIFSPELVGLLEKIHGYVCEEFKQGTPKKIGIFNPSEFLKLYFTAQALAEPEKTERELEERYCNPESKKAIVNTLSQLRTVLLSDYTLRNQLKTKKISFLRLSSTQQMLLQDFLRNYATNQILSVWQKKGEVCCPPIARSLRLRGIAMGKNLRIEDGILRCSSEFSPDFAYRPTNRHVPFVVYLMSKVYDGANPSLTDR